MKISPSGTFEEKPRLLFLQYEPSKTTQPFLRAHKDLHVKCLRQFFDVELVQHDADYEALCDKYDPDISLFEAGGNRETGRRLKITRANSRPDIPKIALHNADAWSSDRSGFRSDLDHWDIETYFSICCTEVEHSPEMRDRAFVWANFIDPDVFYKPTDTPKSTPVLVTGAQNSLYPWRRRISRKLLSRFPAQISQHPGYSARFASETKTTGRTYAKMIASAWFVPTCGTVAKEVVRKHFEIPACGSCLVTEKSDALELAGFVDMQNCVIADGNEVIEKVEYLLNHREKLEAIIDAGHDLVHSQHTYRQRDQVHQWFKLQTLVGPDDRIVQTSPFGDLAIVAKSSKRRSQHVLERGDHVQLIAKAYALLFDGELKNSERKFRQCLSYISFMPEPQLGLGICYLQMGDAKSAMRWIRMPIEHTLCEYGASEPDPLEWAWYVVALLCLGRRSQARDMAREFEWVRHQHLDRVRWLISVLDGKSVPETLRPEQVKMRSSIHTYREMNIGDWVDHMASIFAACNQQPLATDLIAHVSGVNTSKYVLVDESEFSPDVARWKGQISVPPGASIKTQVSRTVSKIRRRRSLMNHFNAWKHRLRVLSKALLAPVAEWLPARVLPLPANQVFRNSRELSQEEPIEHALIIGASNGDPLTEGVIAGLYLNPKTSSVICILAPDIKQNELTRYDQQTDFLSCYPMKCLDFRSEVERIKSVKGIAEFQLVVVAGPNATQILAENPVLSESTSCPSYVLVDHPGEDRGQKLLSELELGLKFAEDYQYFERGSRCVALARR